MTKKEVVSRGARGRYANTGYGPHLDIVDIGSDEYVAVIEGDTAFWALLPKGSATDAIKDGTIRKTFRRKADAMQREMQALRFGLTPSAVYFNPTERCNLNCSYCYLPGKMRRSGVNMSAEKVCRALGILRSYFKSSLPRGRKPQLVFHGSEPMVVRDAVFAGIEKFADDFRFGVQTNATLLDDEAIDFLRSHGVGIGISLDGHRAQVADRTRHNWSGGGSFRKVTKMLERLADYPALNVICTVTQANVRSLTKIVEFLHGHGVPIIMLNPVRCTQPGGRALKPDNELLAREFTRALDRACELGESTGRKIVIANFANVLIGIVAPAARRLMCDISPCGGGRCFFAVSAKGDVSPCSEFIGMPQFKGGNLFKTPIPKILDSKPFQDVTGRMIEQIEPCATCAIRHFCGAPCPAEVHACEGTLCAPSAYCEFYEEQARYAFRVIAQGRENAYLWDGWKRGTNERFRIQTV
ncbi:MAG: peptide-modifying radical SAM enzyme CbpB [Planctomycetes bacterium]|nr:peptide-modifying radical SAM enzyme CbpB [Planctomycetota bacterium]